MYGLFVGSEWAFRPYNTGVLVVARMAMGSGGPVADFGKESNYFCGGLRA